MRRNHPKCDVHYSALIVRWNIRLKINRGLRHGLMPNNHLEFSIDGRKFADRETRQEDHLLNNAIGDRIAVSAVLTHQCVTSSV